MFRFRAETVVIVLLMIVFVFGGMRFPGMREMFLQDGEQQPTRGRRSRIDWFLIAAAAVFGVLMLLVLSYHPRH